MDNKGLISIVILNWNGQDIIEKCIESILNQTYKNVEFIIVDNGSSDQSYMQAINYLENRSIEYKTTVFPNNIGFASGMNEGIKHSTGEFCILLNEDVILEETYLQKAIDCFNNNKDVGIVGGKIFKLINGEKTTEIDSCGSYLLKRFKTVKVNDKDKSTLTFGVSGCCPMVRKVTLEAIELNDGEFYDDDYFAYFEDLDLYYRCQLIGWKSFYNAEMLAWHVRSASMGGKKRTVDKPDFFQVHVFKNRYLTMYKNMSLQLFISKLPYLFITELALFSYMVILKPKKLKNLLRAYREAFKLRTKMRLKRKMIQDSVQITHDYINKFYVRY
ncbi:glycosyltransferase family 2 protein [Shouchella miscanthi]|uniref:Glycosyltransferase family 2 protein n=1 Tax=Shouchella miscanthi TaxID=2598861 RepID=A0ABU6NQ73_9BACI|nr:glycosyltransferase family 2 protein [Shouchella miscanthi]